MSRNLKLLFIFIITILDIFFIIAQVCVTAVNFTWSPWFDSEAMFVGIMLLFHPITLVTVILLLCLNFIINETNYNGKILLISIGIHFLMVFIFISVISSLQNTPNFFTITNAILLVITFIFLIAILLLLVNLIKSSYKLIKKQEIIR